MSDTVADAVHGRSASGSLARSLGGRLRFGLARKLSLAGAALVALLILFEAVGTSWLAYRDARDVAFIELGARADRLADRVALSAPGTEPAALLRALPSTDRSAALYLTDAGGRVLAHPDPALVGRDLSSLPQVAAALAAAPGDPTGREMAGRGAAGESVLVAWRLAPGGWRAFAEMPAGVTHGAIWAALLRSLALLVFGLLLAVLGGTVLARRFVAQIRRLQRGADRFGGGDYSQRIVLRTGDELELLASRFNQMGSRLQDGYAAMEAKVAERTRELGLSLEQQTATAEVLEVISRSGSDLDTILRTLADTAARLCRSGLAQIFRRDGDVYHHWVSHNHHADYRAIEERAAIAPGQGSLVGRVALAKRAVHIADCLADPAYALKVQAQLGGLRTMLGVPLLSRGEPIGVFTVARSEVEPFTDRQIKLLTTFADQAVIAIENARLFEQVEARTRDLARSLQELSEAQDRLVQTEKLASLGQLTAGIAHEIKNPLNFVNNFAALSVDLIAELRETLAAEPLGDDARADVDELGEMLTGNLEKVVSHGRRADSIVKNMLLHSREGAGDHRQVDVNALVEESVGLAYHGARVEKPGFNVTLEKSLDPAVGSVDLYPQEVTRVLLNLVTNGFYATAKRLEGGREPGFAPTLRVCTRDLGSAVEIRVRDNGTGIPEDVKAKIFNPFFTTKPAGEGTGLGLSLSHDIVVKQHGGTLAVETEPGAWTEFTITLPRDGASRRAVPTGAAA